MTIWEYYQREFERTVLRPLIAHVLDRMYAHGGLPLPPLGWGRAEVWYVGDLR